MLAELITTELATRLDRSRDDLWCYSDALPIGTFYHFVKLTPDEEHCLSATMRDQPDLKAVRQLLDFASQAIQGLDTAGLHKVSGLRLDNYPFDVAVICAATYHDRFAQCEAIHNRTLEVFPAAAFELSGSETPDQLRAIRRRRLLATVDWNRTPVPMVRLRLLNRATAASTDGVTFVITSLDYATHEIDSLPLDDTSYVELQNFQSRIARLRRRSDGYHFATVDDGNACVARTRGEALSIVDSFLCGGPTLTAG